MLKIDRCANINGKDLTRVLYEGHSRQDFGCQTSKRAFKRELLKNYMSIRECQQGEAFLANKNQSFLKITVQFLF